VDVPGDVWGADDAGVRDDAGCSPDPDEEQPV